MNDWRDHFPTLKRIIDDLQSQVLELSAEIERMKSEPPPLRRGRPPKDRSNASL